MDNSVLDQILKGILIALGSAAPAVIAWACSWLKTYIEAHVSNAHLKTLLLEADDVVAFINQRMADDMKAAAADGKLTDEEKASLKAKATELIKERLKGLPAKYLTTERIDAAIEAAVNRNRSTVNPPTVPPSPSAVQPWDTQTK